MNLLVVNDDGIDARGIYELAKALAEEANVYVVAPHIQRSATGHGITVGKPITIKELDCEKYCKKAKMVMEISGMPADCVKLGLRYLSEKGIEIDYVFSGINHGGNLGTDTLYSGTVSAAIEGAICGKPSVALSANSHEPTHFSYACKLAVSTLHKMEKAKGRPMVLSINVPDLPKEKIKGVTYTRLGIREYEDWLLPKPNGHGEKEYWYHGNPVMYKSRNISIDVIADQEDYASITPLKFDLTDHNLIDEIKEWRIEDEGDTNQEG